MFFNFKNLNSLYETPLTSCVKQHFLEAFDKTYYDIVDNDK